MTKATAERLPQHLRRYVVEQSYSKYTPEDQAVWRYIMRQLKDFLSKNAHESYVSGLEKTGIHIDRIPSIAEIDEHLEKFGWGAVPVSGFIPPAAFMEFQSLSILPIASDMRTLDHLLYTPAPDIVHEAAGHAPILVHPEFAAYLRRYADVAKNAILSKEDLDQYEAIRVLSDVKENPASTSEDIQRAEDKLNEVNKSLRYTSEGGLLSRMNWWTAEYGLIGDLDHPKILGAGLLSSIGEARECLKPKVRKIPLTVECVDYSYDITEPQPQLFVTPDFTRLNEVLDKLSERMAFRRGGRAGLDEAIRARTVNTVQLNSGVQVSGVLNSYRGEAVFLKFEDACQVSFQNLELPNQGIQRHPDGYSTPVGLLKGESRCLSEATGTDLTRLGIALKRNVTLDYASGVKVEGQLKDWHRSRDRLLLLTFTNCRVSLNGETLFDPAWGDYDLAVGSIVQSVFGGPADRVHYGATEEFVASRVPEKAWSEKSRNDFTFFQKIRDLRESLTTPQSQQNLRELIKSYVSQNDEKWLKGVELLELSYKLKLPEGERQILLQKLGRYSQPQAQQCIQDGIRLAQTNL